MNFFQHFQQDFNNISRQFHLPPPSFKPPQPIQLQPFKQPPIIPPTHFIPFPVPLPPPLQPIFNPVITAPIQHPAPKPDQPHQPTIDPQEPKSTLIDLPTIKPTTQSTFSDLIQSDQSYILYGLAGLGVVVYIFNKN